MRLLDRQISLLEFLTSSAAIFGAGEDVIVDESLQGIDQGLLRLEARFSFEKRMEKIGSVFPLTLQLLGIEQEPIVRLFIAACPPFDISRIENARQFYQFLYTHWEHTPTKPPYLPDVATCELAYEQFRITTSGPELAGASSEIVLRRPSVRRMPGIILFRSAYDIQPLFETRSLELVPAECNTGLVIAVPPDADRPKVFELHPLAFEFLAGLDDWTARSALDLTPDLDELISELAAHGLVEVYR